MAQENSGVDIPRRSFADIDSGTSKVVAEALIMLEEPAKFEFVHRLLVWALHDRLRGSNSDVIMIVVVANVEHWLGFRHSECAAERSGSKRWRPEHHRVPGPGPAARLGNWSDTDSGLGLSPCVL